MLTKERKRIHANLQALKDFPRTETVRKLRSELLAKLKDIERKIATESKLQAIKEKQNRRIRASLSRSGKLRKYHNYLRQIRNSYPDVSYSDLRKMFKLRKEGKEVEVPDVIWQNPSP